MESAVCTTPRRWNAPDRDLVVTRTFNGPARLVFDAWTRPELFKQWWGTEVDCAMTMVSCEIDARTRWHIPVGVQPSDFPEPMAFFGRYLEVINALANCLTNDEAGWPVRSRRSPSREHGDQTRLVMHDLYPSKDAARSQPSPPAARAAQAKHLSSWTICW